MTEELEWVPEEARSQVKERLEYVSKRTGIPYEVVVRFYQGYYVDLIGKMIHEKGCGYRRYAEDLKVSELHSIMTRGFVCHFLSSSCKSCLTPLRNSVARFIWNIIKQQMRSGVCKIHRERLAEVTGVSDEYVDVVLQEYARFHGYRYENGVLSFAKQ